MMRILKRRCAHVNISCVDFELEPVIHEVFNYAIDKLNAKTVDEKLDHFFKNLKCVANLAFRFVLKKFRRRRGQIISHTRKQYLAGSVQTCVHQGQLGKAKRFSQQNWCHRVLWPRQNPIDCDCCFTLYVQGRTYKVQGRSLTRTYFEKLHLSTVSKLKETRDNHITTTCVFFLLLLSICTKINDWNKKLQN